MLVGKTKLNTIAILVSKALIDSYISHDEFVSVNNMLREYNEMKEEIKKSWNFCGIYYIKAIETCCIISSKKNTANENSSATKTKRNRLMFLFNCSVCGKKKLTFIKNKITPLRSIQQF